MKWWHLLLAPCTIIRTWTAWITTTLDNSKRETFSKATPTSSHQWWQTSCDCLHCDLHLKACYTKHISFTSRFCHSHHNYFCPLICSKIATTIDNSQRERHCPRSGEAAILIVTCLSRKKESWDIISEHLRCCIWLTLTPALTPIWPLIAGVTCHLSHSLTHIVLLFYYRGIESWKI